MAWNRLWFASSVSVLSLGCGKSHSQQAAPAPSVSASAAASSAPVASTFVTQVAPRTGEELLTAWTAALNDANSSALEALYAERVKFYGQLLSREEVVARKRKALAAAPGFKQQVIGQPSYQDQGESIRVFFQKRSGRPGAQNDVRSTLVFVKTPRLEIAEETDAATEKRFSRSNDAAKADSCDDAVWTIVGSTSFAKQLYAEIDRNLKGIAESEDLHAGGMGPFLPAETGGTYDVWIGVHHPERFENYATVSVTPQGQISVSCVECEPPDGGIPAAASALADFKRLCMTR